MPRRKTHRKPQRGYQKQGRHKRRVSKETRRWESECLIPARPVWMDTDTYTKLAELREAS